MSFATLRCGFAQEPQNPPSDPKTDQSQSQSQGQSPGKENPPADSTPPSSQASPSTPSSQSPQSSDKPSADKPEDKKDDTPNPAQVVAEATKQAATATLVKVRDWETEWLVGAYVSRNRKLVTLTAEQRKKLYLHQTLLT